jgi:hypothetical protein
MIIKNTSSLSLQITAAVAIVVLHHLCTPSPPAGRSLCLLPPLPSPHPPPSTRRSWRRGKRSNRQNSWGTPCPTGGTCDPTSTWKMHCSGSRASPPRPPRPSAAARGRGRIPKDVSEWATVWARWHIPVFVPFFWGPESRAGFLFQLDSGGIRPQHPWCSVFSTGRNPTILP